MPRLIWSRRANTDIERIRAFLKAKDPDAARRAVAAIAASVRQLQAFPKMGRRSEVVGPPYREWPVRFGSSGYVVLYRLDAETIQLIAIRHMREDGFPDFD